MENNLRKNPFIRFLHTLTNYIAEFSPNYQKAIKDNLNLELELVLKEGQIQSSTKKLEEQRRIHEEEQQNLIRSYSTALALQRIEKERKVQGLEAQVRLYERLHRTERKRNEAILERIEQEGQEKWFTLLREGISKMTPEELERYNINSTLAKRIDRVTSELERAQEENYELKVMRVKDALKTLVWFEKEYNKKVPIFSLIKVREGYETGPSSERFSRKPAYTEVMQELIINLEKNSEDLNEKIERGETVSTQIGQYSITLRPYRIDDKTAAIGGYIVPARQGRKSRRISKKVAYTAETALDMLQRRIHEWQQSFSPLENQRLNLA